MIEQVRERFEGVKSSLAVSFRNRNIGLLQLASSSSLTADAAFTIGLGILALRAGGATEVGVVAVLRLLPAQWPRRS